LFSELDPHGADEQGNPLGGIVFSNAFGVNSNAFDTGFHAKQNGSSTYTQVIEWIDFIGGGVFCLKMCNPTYANSPKLCNHIYDRIGCSYNALADYNSIKNTFQVCDSDDMTPVGEYTVNGQSMTWTQGPEGQPVVPPYTPTLPASSNCHTYASSELFAAAATVTPSVPPSAAPTATASGKPSSGGSSTASRSGTAQGATNTGGAVAVGASFVGLPMMMTVLLAAILA
jgi:hypothetical protein